MNSILDFEIVQNGLVLVLRSKAGVREVAIHMAPFSQTPVVEEFQLLGDNERYDAVCKAFLEHYQTPDTSVPVLEGMDGLELLVEVDDVLKRFFLLGVVGFQQGGYPIMDFFRRAGLISAHLVRKPLVVPDIEPRLPAVGCPGLEDAVKLLDEGFAQAVGRMVDDEVDAAEVVGGFYDVVHIYRLVRDADGVGFEDVACLLMGQAAPFDVVGVVGEVNLGAVVNAATDIGLLLIAETLQERGFLLLPLLGRLGITGDVPCLSGEEGSRNLPGGTPVPDRPLGDAERLCEFADRNVLHALSASFN